ncbi:MAG: peptidoglycan DD-metalloendopeptidase family protein [Candidatus Peribacteraceae bacterium]|nr:peptidoglycan DD-metalloendopeptidase family protein [Candidatus Peribacteraceae bacterium]
MICIAVLVVGSLLPPYIPKAALALEETQFVPKQFLLVEDGFLMKTSMLTNYGARRAYTKGRIHIVKDAENLEKLSERYSIAVDTIRWANNLRNGDAIHPGDELLILPVDGVIHTVSRGQTISRIAELYEITTEDILERNDLESQYILAGQDLIIPGARPIIGKPTVVASAERPSSSDKEIPDGKEPVVVGDDIPDVTPPVVIQTAEEIPSRDITGGVLQKPCSADCFITQYSHAGHYALDLQERGGGNIYAAEAGTVIRASKGWNGGYGNVIEIDHGNGLVTLYAHNKKLYVKKGDRAERGSKIADMGNTGLVYGKTGIHVHFEVRLKGVKKNPLLYVE